MIILIYFIRFLIFSINIYEYIFFAYIIMSYFPLDENNFLVRFIKNIIEPVYFFIIEKLPPLRIGFIDFSPIYMIIILNIIDYLLRFLLSVLY